MHYIKYISPPILGFKWDWSVAKCTEHYVASCTSFSFEQELHYSGGWRLPSPFQWSFHCQIFEQLPTKKTLITLISVPFSDLRISVAITLSTILPLPNLCQFHQLLRKRTPAHWGGRALLCSHSFSDLTFTEYLSPAFHEKSSIALEGPLEGPLPFLFIYMQHFHHDIVIRIKSIFRITSTHVAQWSRWRCLASNWEQDAPS